MTQMMFSKVSENYKKNLLKGKKYQNKLNFGKFSNRKVSRILFYFTILLKKAIFQVQFGENLELYYIYNLFFNYIKKCSQIIFEKLLFSIKA